MVELNRIYTGDCIEVMATWPDNFIDTIITDPPYGLSFMGKSWDHGVPGIPFWAEMLRICKPGAMLLSFGGTRTFHRMTVAIEDAGWEIRDCLMHLYGQGFPKSHNFGCKCSGKPVQYNHEDNSDLLDMQKEIPEAEMLDQENQETLLYSEMQRKGTSEEPDSLFREHERTRKEGQEIRSIKPIMEGGKLHRTKEGLSNDPNASPSKSQGKRVRSRAHSGGGENIGPSLETARGSASQKSQESGQSSSQSSDIQGPLRTLDDGTFQDGTCQTCGGLKAWKGWGSALKPAFEPIILAMKPLDGTFAQNAEKWGVAGLNVDGGRIGIGADKASGGNAGQNKTAGGLHGGGISRSMATDYTRGRWPANLILDEEAAAMLDGQSGALSSGGYQRGSLLKNDGGIFGNGKPRESLSKLSFDSGGASRFFYVAKADRAERNEGCEELPSINVNDGRDTSIDNPFQRGDTLRTNTHPTVKPLSLMKYLCNLTKTPSGGIVLDPFAGSGTTLWAAECHNRPWIGIEQNAEYVKIAEARIARERAQLKMSL